MNKKNIVVVEPNGVFSDAAYISKGVYFDPEIVLNFNQLIEDTYCSVCVLSDKRKPFSDILQSVGMTRPVDYVFKDEKELMAYLKPRIKTHNVVILSTNRKYRKIGDSFVFVNYNVGLTKSDLERVKTVFNY